MKIINFPTFIIALILCAFSGGIVFAGVENTLVATAMVFPVAASEKNALLQKVISEVIPKLKGHEAFRNYDIGSARISETYVRMELPVSNNQTQYSFDPAEKRGLNTPTEKLVKQNDLFVPTHVSMFLASVNPDKESAVQLQTYPNFQVFETAGGITAEDLYIFYNGQLAIKTGLEELRPIPTSDFLYVPETQQSSATNKSQYNALKNVRRLLAPMTVFSGRADQEIILNVKTYNGIDLVDNTFETRVILQFDGFNLFNMARA